MMGRFQSAMAMTHNVWKPDTERQVKPASFWAALAVPALVPTPANSKAIGRRPNHSPKHRVCCFGCLKGGFKISSGNRSSYGTGLIILK